MVDNNMKKLIQLMESVDIPVEEQFRDELDRRDYVNHKYDKLKTADTSARAASNLAAQGNNNTALTPDQQERRFALARAKQSDADKLSTQVAYPDYDRDNLNSAPNVYSRMADKSRDTVNQLTKQIRSAPRPQLPRESVIHKIYRNNDGSATVVLESGDAYWYASDVVSSIVNESGKIDRNKL